MRHLLVLLNDGTHVTPAEPSVAQRAGPGKSASAQTLAEMGTLGTRGTLESNDAAAFDDLTQRIASLADAWHERVAICLEAGDIAEGEAHLIAEAEIGRRFVEAFMRAEMAP